MKLNFTDLLCLTAIVAVSGLAAYLYPSLPDPVPTHWNFRGEINGYTPKPWGVVVMPALAIIVFLIFKVIGPISPRGFRMESFQGITDILKTVLTLGLAAIGIVALLAASGRDVPMGQLSPFFLGSVFIILGSCLGKVRKNFFIGIRTPWTLASDEVWARTHRLGGWTFALAGFAILAFARDSNRTGVVILSAIGIAALVPVCYSFLLYRKLEGFDEEPG